MASIELRTHELDYAVAKVGKINKRAAKLGLAPITLKEVRRFTRLESRWPEGHPFYGLDSDRVERQYIEIEYTTDIVKVAGYAPVATLTWEHDEPIAYVWPGETLTVTPSDPTCDHCGKIRRRLRTFVLRHEDTGALNVVGSTCVQDFIGYDPSRLINQAQWFAQIEDMDADEDSAGSMGGPKVGHDVQQVLITSAAAIRLYGWASMRQAREMEGVIPTATHVYDWMYERKAERLQRPRPIIIDEDRDMANQAIFWAANLSDNEVGRSEYLRNVRVIAREGWATDREFNLTASVVASYQRTQARQAERAAQTRVNRSNVHLGELGGKVSATVKLVASKAIDSYYGVTTLTKWVTTEGATITWFATGHKVNKWEIGSEYKITGRVKAHKEFNGNLETVLTRCRVEGS